MTMQTETGHGCYTICMSSSTVVSLVYAVTVDVACPR